MVAAGLTAFWIVPPSHQGPLGLGVTAWSIEDALQIIQHGSDRRPGHVVSLRGAWHAGLG
jgi:hypothetical protein